MKNIKVTLLHHTPLYISAIGARTCWDSFDKSDTEGECIGSKDLALIDRVGNQYHHSSILEHISFNFFIDGISRACLQELARHRMASLSVKSSRYTLSELRDAPKPWETALGSSGNPLNMDVVSRFCVLTDDDDVNLSIAHALAGLQALLIRRKSNDVAKYAMIEAYRTQLTWTINLRSLQNFLSLRTDKKALPEIQHLAKLIYEALPADAQSLVKHCVKLEKL